MKHDKGEYGGLPAPDAKDPDHGNFVRDWFGQISDEELGNEPVDEFYGLSVGEVVRDKVLAVIGEIEMRHARRVAAIERAAIVAYEESTSRPNRKKHQEHTATDGSKWKYQWCTEWWDLVEYAEEGEELSSLPDVGSPEALQFAANVVEATCSDESGPGDDVDDYWPEHCRLSASDLRRLADRLEREQAAKTAQDHAIEQAATLIGEQMAESGGTVLDAARAMFDAGLLKAGEQ